MCLTDDLKLLGGRMRMGETENRMECYKCGFSLFNNSLIIIERDNTQILKLQCDKDLLYGYLLIKYSILPWVALSNLNKKSKNTSSIWGHSGNTQGLRYSSLTVVDIRIYSNITLPNNGNVMKLPISSYFGENLFLHVDTVIYFCHICGEIKLSSQKRTLTFL